MEKLKFSKLCLLFKWDIFEAIPMEKEIYDTKDVGDDCQAKMRARLFSSLFLKLFFRHKTVLTNAKAEADL